MTYSVSPSGEISANPAKDDFLEKLLGQYPEYFDHILKNRDSFKVQIIYTQIDREANNRPKFKDHYFNLHAGHYFYPASTVKMPIALLALQRLNELKEKGIDRSSSMITESAYSGQTSVYNDPTTADGRPTIEHYIKKIFLVSDNDAYNRLYEFLGQQYINEELRKKGYKEAEIIHRLDIALSEDENRHTNPVAFFDIKGKKLYEEPMKFNEQPHFKRRELLGNSHYSAGVLKNEPLSFSKKNRISLESLHGILKSIVFPESVPAKQRFNISTNDYRLVWQYMSQLPGETRFPPYDTATYYDTYCKFLMYGSEKEAKIPASIRVFNKVGDAYGFLLDVAYIADFEKKIEFMLSAVIYCNGDGILNDDQYDYETVGFPFMKQLGRAVYNHELQRKRTNLPDLSTLQINYEK
ncbi:MAG: serine hydrolase [Chitinophagaceae bacterium]|nr:serine hydrolase [Chitinophagaceae bacterium]